MSVPKIDVVENPDPALREPIEKGLAAFNDQALGPGNREHLAIVLRDPETEDVIGGIWAIFFHKWLFVEYLFVPEALRGTGMGSSLMAKAEETARARGCKGVHLDTFEFQAPRFYEKLGYVRYGKLDNLVGREQYFYVKKFGATQA